MSDLGDSNSVPYGLAPQWALFWSEAGEGEWDCVGIYATRQQAIDAFDMWAHTNAGRIVMSQLTEAETRDVHRQP